MVPRCLTIATSDSGGGAGVQADLRAFAAAGCYGASVIVGLTAQNTVGIEAVHEVPAEFVEAQLRAVLGDIGADAVKTGALLSADLVEVVAAGLSGRGLPLVVDPVVAATTGRRLSDAGALAATVKLLFPLATVVTPNLREAELLAGGTGSRRELAERIAARGAAAVLVTGGHGEPVDHLFAGGEHLEIPVPRHPVAATHGAGCTHSATLAAELAKGQPLRAAAERSAAVTAEAVRRGLTEIGAGEGPVDVTGLGEAR
ncbi:MAG: bifunctional hydroxymethylpyrimidine kinase/phosphomethylpyrimidine kinase [Candidatus Dormibacteraeota bacterium]|nr:bifunctional hydroxymethylpyrimidine kinase/phosphomethylpyrimidine kinase [Candidatus Dormibacteraeota bacterium]